MLISSSSNNARSLNSKFSQVMESARRRIESLKPVWEKYGRTATDIAGSVILDTAYDVPNLIKAVITDSTISGQPVDTVDKFLLVLSCLPVVTGPMLLEIRSELSAMSSLEKNVVDTYISNLGIHI